MFSVVDLEAVRAHICAFEPTPDISSNDTLVIDVDCHRLTAAPDWNRIDVTGRLIVTVTNCHDLPVGLLRYIGRLTELIIWSDDDVTVNIPNGTLEGLETLSGEFRLQGFQKVDYIDRLTFYPLRNVHTVILSGVGCDYLSYTRIGTALAGLSNTPLRRLVLHNVHSVWNKDNTIILDELFPMTNVVIEELISSDNVVHSLKGSYQKIFPRLKYLCVSHDIKYNEAQSAVINVLFGSPTLDEVIFYVFPDRRQAPLNVSLPLSHRPCYWDMLLPINANLRRLTVQGTRFLEAYVPEDLCFDTENTLEHLDFTGCPMPSTFPHITGFNHLNSLILQDTDITSLPSDFLWLFPELKLVSLSLNSIGGLVSRQNSSFLTQTLNVLYMDNCQLNIIPSDFYLNALSMEEIHLADNQLESFDVDISRCPNLTLIDLSRNRLSSLKQRVVNQLGHIAHGLQDESRLLVIDLSENPLLCYCNVTYFISFLQTSLSNQRIAFNHFPKYTCSYPNGSIVRVQNVNVGELQEQCRVIEKIVNGSDCPCDDTIRRGLELVWKSLDGYFCRDDDGQLVSMSVLPLPICRNIYTKASFIVPVVICCCLAVATVASIIVLYRYRHTQRLQPLTDCLTAHWGQVVDRALMYLLSQNHREHAADFDYDVFVFYHDGDHEIVEDIFKPRLSPTRTIRTNDDLPLNCIVLDALLKQMDSCRFVMPIVTRGLLADADGLSLDFITRAVFLRPHAVIAVIWDPTEVVEKRSELPGCLRGHWAVLTWPGNDSSPETLDQFWADVLDRTTMTTWTGI